MILWAKVDPTWRRTPGKRPYSYVRHRKDGTVRPVRYAGLKGVIGRLLGFEDGKAVVSVW